MEKYNKRSIPIYTLKNVDEVEELGIDAISLVEQPAVGYSFMTLSDEKNVKQVQVGLSVSNIEKQILSGVLLLADIPIYRFNVQYKEHYIVFSKENIEKIVQKYFKQGKHFRFNISHDQQQFVEDTYLFESYIIDRERGVYPPKGYETVPNGSWFGSVKIENKELWKKIKQSDIYGFSIEGLFEYNETPKTEDEEFDDFMRALAKLFNKNTQYKKKDKFVSPRSGESEDDFISRCIPVVVGEGYDVEQATAICHSYLGKVQLESYNDYPESATNAARRALEWRDEHPEQDCGTQVGWTRANQLANRENISEETIARMASFARHLQYEDVPYSEGCGGLMVDAWGGRAGIEWAQNKLEEIRNE